jgi:hypothetical protein
MRKGEQGICVTVPVASGTLGGGGEVEAIGSQMGVSLFFNQSPLGA